MLHILTELLLCVRERMFPYVIKHNLTLDHNRVFCPLPAAQHANCHVGGLAFFGLPLNVSQIQELYCTNLGYEMAQLADTLTCASRS